MCIRDSSKTTGNPLTPWSLVFVAELDDTALVREFPGYTGTDSSIDLPIAKIAASAVDEQYVTTHLAVQAVFNTIYVSRV